MRVVGRHVMVNVSVVTKSITVAKRISGMKSNNEGIRVIRGVVMVMTLQTMLGFGCDWSGGCEGCVV